MRNCAFFGTCQFWVETFSLSNRATLQCIRTTPCDYALCSLFAPGDRHVLIGAKVRFPAVICLAAHIFLPGVGLELSFCRGNSNRSISFYITDRENTDI